MAPSQLTALQRTDVESLFVSPRDGQPYVVRYGLKFGGPSPGGSPVVAYEQTGVGGYRYVAFAVGGAEQVDEKRFRELVPEP